MPFVATLAASAVATPHTFDMRDTSLSEKELLWPARLEWFNVGATGACRSLRVNQPSDYVSTRIYVVKGYADLVFAGRGFEYRRKFIWNCIQCASSDGF